MQVIAAEEPQCGSILNGAKVMFAMQDFDTYLCVSKQEYEED